MFENLKGTAMDATSKGREMVAKFKKPMTDKMAAVKSAVAGAKAATKTAPTLPSQASAQARESVMKRFTK